MHCTNRTLELKAVLALLPIVLLAPLHHPPTLQPVRVLLHQISLLLAAYMVDQDRPLRVDPQVLMLTLLI